MGGIGPEGLPRREQTFANAPLFPVGSDTIRKVLPTISPENISTLAQQKRPAIQVRDAALIDLLNLVHKDYHERERGVGADSFLDFYAGVVFVDSFLQERSPQQIPKVVRNEKRNDVPELLNYERNTQSEYATNLHVPESSVERIAYERIREFARKDEQADNSGSDISFGQTILDFAGRYPYDDGAFLVGAAAYLSIMEVMWLEEQKQKRLTQQEENKKVDTVIRLWPSAEREEVDELLATVTGDTLAEEIYSVFDRGNQPGQQDAA